MNQTSQTPLRQTNIEVLESNSLLHYLIESILQLKNWLNCKIDTVHIWHYTMQAELLPLHCHHNMLEKFQWHFSGMSHTELMLYHHCTAPTHRSSGCWTPLGQWQTSSLSENSQLLLLNHSTSWTTIDWTPSSQSQWYSSHPSSWPLEWCFHTWSNYWNFMSKYINYSMKDTWVNNSILESSIYTL